MYLPRVVLRRYVCFWLVLATLVSFVCFFPPPTTAVPRAQEHEIKAVFFLNLGSFVIFPDGVLKENEPFKLCVLGDDPFRGVLDFAAENKTIQKHELTVDYYQDVNQVNGCHALYISNSKEHELEKIFTTLRHQPILTASDIDNFVRQGGMVKFYTVNKKIRLAVSPMHFSNAGLQASAHLMRVATVVTTNANSADD